MPSWAARNPLGIIALFISLIYAMSALLLGFSIDNLAPDNQTILVTFIAIFPFVVLGVFGWLVAQHHTKLYGPGDFQSDQGFLEASTSNPASLGERLKQEIDESKILKDIETDQLPNRAFEESMSTGKASGSSNVVGVGNTSNTTPKSMQGPATSTEISDQNEDQIDEYPALRQAITNAYLAESLVFQELQHEMDGSIRREVILPSRTGRGLHIDGLIKTNLGTTIVEIRNISNPEAIRSVIRLAATQMGRYKEEIPSLENDKIKILLVFIVHGKYKRKLKDIINKNPFMYSTSFDTLVFDYDELLTKYGFLTTLNDVEETPSSINGAYPLDIR